MSAPAPNALVPAPRRMTQRKSRIRREFAHPRAQLAPRRPRQRIELRGSIEDDGCDRAVAFNEDQVRHWAISRSNSRSSSRAGHVAAGANRAANPRRARRKQRPNQQNQRQRRDRSDQAIGPEHAHIPARSDHRQAERVLAAIAQHQREREWRQRYADLLEHIADDTEQQHEPDVEHGVLDGIGADGAGDDDHRRDSGERNAQDRGKDRHRGQHDDESDDIAEIHRSDETPDEILVLDEQQRTGIEPPDHQAAQQDRRRAGAGDSQRQHRQQAPRSRTRAPLSRARTRPRCVPCRSLPGPWKTAWPGCSP